MLSIRHLVGFLGRGRTGFVLGVLVGCLLTTGTIYAVEHFLLRGIPATVTVVDQPVSDIGQIEVYSDPACQHELSVIDFGSVGRGMTASADFYIKYKGWNPAQISLSSSLKPLVSASSISGRLDSSTSWELSMDEVGHFFVQLGIRDDAPLGTHNFAVQVYKTNG